jgi:predicted phage terminase large subunit-like protein
MVTTINPNSVSKAPAPVAIEDGLRKWRIEKTIDDPFEFGRIYFPKYWFQKSPDFHKEIMDLATHKNEEEWSTKNNLNTLVLAAPRNHSKSTLITFLYVIWSLVTQRKFFTVIISDIARISVGHTRNIKEEFETNERLCNDWGIILGREWESLAGAAKGEKEKWTDEEFVIGFKKWDKYNNCWSNELEDRAKILARMANNPLRGLRFGFRRPDLVIADDLENDELVDTAVQREKLAQWWDSAVEPMIEPPPIGQIILVGTVLHYGSLLNQMLGRPDLYVTRRYQAITTREDEDGVKRQVPLWPERFSLERLSSLKAKNVLAFQKEYMNDPRDDSTRTFRSSWVQWYDARDLGYRQDSRKWYFRGKPMVLYTGVDWSVGKDDQSDFFAMVMIGRTPDNDIVIFDVVSERLDVANQVNRVIQQNQTYKIQMNGIEGNGFQHVLIQQVLRKSLLPIREIHHVSRKKKQIRIEGMAPLFEQAKIYIRKCTESEIQRDELTSEPDASQGYHSDELRMAIVHPEFWSLYEQMMTYPRSQYDDILDALEMAIETSRSGKRLFDEIIVV